MKDDLKLFCDIHKASDQKSEFRAMKFAVYMTVDNDRTIKAFQMSLSGF